MKTNNQFAGRVRLKSWTEKYGQTSLKPNPDQELRCGFICKALVLLEKAGEK